MNAGDVGYREGLLFPSFATISGIAVVGITLRT